MNAFLKQRDSRIDALKGVLILLVVLGHCIGHDTSFRVNMTAYNYIYLFHMPLFVFMSGYFTRMESGHFWNRVLSFIYIYFFWQVVKSVYLRRSLIYMIALPAPMMWYLLSLTIWCVLYWFTQKIKHKIAPTVIIAVCIAIALIAGFIPRVGSPFALSRTLVFAPFFFLGVSLQNVNFVEICNKIPYWVAWLVLLAAFVALLIIKMDISIIVRGVSPYPKAYPVYGLAGRLVYYVAAVVMSSALIRLVMPNKLMSEVGRDTMKYFIFHGVILMVMYKMKIPWSFDYAVVYWICISILLFFFNKWKMSDYILNPIGKTTEIIGNRNIKD